MDRILDAALTGAPLQVHLCNAFTLSLVRTDKRLRACLGRDDALNLPDGRWVARLFGGSTARAVRGPDVFRTVLERGSHLQIRHYLYGGSPDAIAGLERNIRKQFPQVHIVGAVSPPYGSVDGLALDQVVQDVIAAQTQILWVGLGTPKQDYLVPILAEGAGVVVVPVGAAFDFLAGTQPEAPSWLRDSGFEWVHRLFKEPKRLSRRYLVNAPGFVLDAIIEQRIRR